MPVKHIRRFPVVKTMASYLCINLAADFTEQVFLKKHNRSNYDVAKTARIGTVGCFVIGPLVYNWIRLIDRLIPGKTLFSVVRKVVFDSCFFAPVGITSFYISTNILEGQSDLTKEWKEKFTKTWMTGLMYWPFIQTVNFAFIPVRYKTSVYMPVCSFIWTNYLCYMKDASSLMYWPFIQAVNFALVPVRYKTSVYMPMCSFIWVNFLCLMKDTKIRPDPPVPITMVTVPSLPVSTVQTQNKAQTSESDKSISTIQTQTQAHNSVSDKSVATLHTQTGIYSSEKSLLNQDKK